MRVTYFTTEAGRSQAVDFLDGLQARDAAAILADIETLRLHGDRSPVQMRPIKGARPLTEIKTGRFRIFFVRKPEEIVVLHICKKQDQVRGIAVSRKRMKELEE